MPLTGCWKPLTLCLRVWAGAEQFCSFEQPGEIEGDRRHQDCTLPYLCFLLRTEKNHARKNDAGPTFIC